jgi:hypothetical protein
MKRRIARMAGWGFAVFAVLLAATESTALAEGVVLADSVQQFSTVQGQDGWSYGYYDRSADPNGTYDAASDFAQMLYYRSDLYDPPAGTSGGRWQVSYNNPNEGGLYWCALWANGGHPNATNTNNVELWPVRRWTSNYDGQVTLTGNLGHLNWQYLGNGLRGRLFVDGTQLWTAHVNPTNSVGLDFSLQIPVHVGSYVDLAVDPEGNDEADWARFQVAITSVPEPASAFLLVIASLGVFSRRRRAY